METVWSEAQQGFRFKPQPLTIFAYEADASPIRNPTDPVRLKSIGVTIADLAAPWVRCRSTPPTWR